MKSETVPLLESVLMLVYVAVTLGSFAYFFHSLLVNLPAAMAVLSDLGLEL
jgi:hypothetical protein